jgi:hypothetical protein
MRDIQPPAVKTLPDACSFRSRCTRDGKFIVEWKQLGRPCGLLFDKNDIFNVAVVIDGYGLAPLSGVWLPDGQHLIWTQDARGHSTLEARAARRTVQPAARGTGWNPSPASAC